MHAQTHTPRARARAHTQGFNREGNVGENFVLVLVLQIVIFESNMWQKSDIHTWLGK